MRSVRTSRHLRATDPDSSSDLQALFDYAAGGEVVFDGPAPTVTSPVSVPSGTRIVGLGETNAVNVGGDHTVLFNAMGSDSVALEDFTASFVGTKTNPSGSVGLGGDNYAADHALFLSNGNGHRLSNVKGIDFDTPFKVSAYNGTDRTTLLPSDWRMSGLEARRASFGLLVDALKDSDISHVAAYEITNLIGGGAPPHAVYVSTHGPVGVRHTGLRFDGLHCDDNQFASAFQFKKIGAGSRATNLTAHDCARFVSVLDCDSFSVDGGAATGLNGADATGLVYFETDGSVRVHRLSVGLADGYTPDVEGRGLVLIGNGVKASDIDIEWRQPAGTTNLGIALGSTSFDTAGYRLRRISVSNTHGAPSGDLVAIRRCGDIDAEVESFGFGTTAPAETPAVTGVNSFTHTALGFA